MSSNKGKSIPEVKLYDSWGEPAAISASLNDIVDYIKSEYPQLTATIHMEDYDEYGCDHYILISGVCANIRLTKDYGSMYFPGNSLICSVANKSIRNDNTGIDHEFVFKEGFDPENVSIYKDYASNIKSYIDSHQHYLEANKDIFSRIDYKWYSDQRGARKFVTSSYDTVCVTDEDFYADIDQKSDYLSSTITVVKQIELYEINTEYCVVIIKKLNHADENPDAGFYDDESDIPLFIASIKDGPSYLFRRGFTAEEAKDSLINDMFLGDDPVLKP